MNISAVTVNFGKKYKIDLSQKTSDEDVKFVAITALTNISENYKELSKIYSKNYKSSVETFDIPAKYDKVATEILNQSGLNFTVMS